MIKRTMIHIDDELCDGCGLCISPCAEGALEIREGKARVISEALCDGAGFCLGICPTGALSLEVKDTLPFSEAAVKKQLEQKPLHYIPQLCFSCGNSEETSYLLPLKKQGQSLWVCTQCLPRLIHG